MKPTRKTRSRLIGARLPGDLVERVDDIAKQSRVFSRSDIIRFLLDRAISAGMARDLLEGVRAAV